MISLCRLHLPRRTDSFNVEFNYAIVGPKLQRQFSRSCSDISHVGSEEGEGGEVRGRLKAAAVAAMNFDVRGFSGENRNSHTNIWRLGAGQGSDISGKRGVG